MSSNKNKRSLKSKIIWALILLVFLVGSVAAGILTRVWLADSNKSAADYTPASEKQPAAIDKAQSDAIKGDISGSNSGLQKYIADTNISDDNRYSALIQLGLNASNTPGQTQKALDYFVQAEKLKQNYTVSHLIAEQYAILGNNSSAIEYFKKAISQLDKNSIGYQSNKQAYEDNIKQLGGQP